MSTGGTSLGARSCGRGRGEVGQVLPLVVFVVLFVVVAALVVVEVGAQVDDRARAQTAADAAALAGARAGEDAAGRMAEVDGGELTSYEARGDEVEVVVRVGRSSATARARRRW